MRKEFIIARFMFVTIPPNILDYDSYLTHTMNLHINNMFKVNISFINLNGF